jgi:Subtilase family/PatG Domain
VELSELRQTRTISIAVIDGPYDGAALSQVLKKAPIELGSTRCVVPWSGACNHGTFIMVLLGARRDAAIPGLCPDCQLLHTSLFDNKTEVSTRVDDLAIAIINAVAAGALIINLSLSILGDESAINSGLNAALNYAEASGAVLVVAVGNQGRLAAGQILAHPATIPVAATDGAGRLLPECNFGPLVARRGFAALGHEVLGYAPGLGTTTMSGTSVAAAVATGTIADVWSTRSEASAKEIFLALSRLAPSAMTGLPLLDRDVLRDTLDRILTSALPAAGMDVTSKLSFHGEKAMTLGVNIPISENRTAVLQSGVAAMPTTVSLACACGNSGSNCTCHEKQGGETGLAYAIGTVEAQYPSVGVEREMQALAKHLGVESEPNARPTENRNWQHAVLSRDRKLSRYLARQLSWRLTIEDGAAFVLSPRDPADFEDLIACLERPKFSEGGRLRDLDVIVGVTGSHTSEGIEVGGSGLHHKAGAVVAVGRRRIYRATC